MKFDIGDIVRKIIHSPYGRAGTPLRGTCYRTTPSGNGIPAQIYVVWDDGEQGWELQRDLA
jgi:hypothetical protein